ncbi:hypothetical protein EHS25_009218 [Saitozyma podzolica]|uniref:Uncharacterized protein n=1 Tax=Saitozyma podzolica TaxID=1890683 RepID=A0A427YL58_9TREE|nr:hypothetical protein EHS25_009218 [Saitozyma podzolica]
MPLRAVIPAAVAATQNYESARLQEEGYYPSYSASSSGVGFGMPREQGLPSYGSTASSNAFTSSDGAGARLGGGDVDGPDEGDGEVEGEVEETPFEEEEEELEVVYQPEQIDVTWRYMSRLYLLVPVITLLWEALLILLVTFAWPPNKRERESGQTYPHPFLIAPFAIGIFASCTVQTLRIPVSTTLHTLLHELVRLSTLPLIVPSPTSGFHSSYYLGLGWGVAEAAWGIVQGWDQLALYEDIMRPSDVEESRETSSKGERRILLLQEEPVDELDEAELERKVEILENMRARRDLEEVIGVPFPNIPFPLHLLWRLDTLLLNLGLTLILSAFYFDPAPIYHHLDSVPVHSVPVRTLGPEASHPGEPSRWLWLAWALVALLHVCVSLVWKVVGRVGVGAVTWGGLIVALGSVFAGLGAWGGLV